jgi:amino acid transporter
MVLAVVVSAVVGYLLLMALTLSIGDLDAILEARDVGGNEVPAVIAILGSALGERAGALFSALAAMAMWFCGLSAVTWSSRVLYAFARDGGLPFAHLWRRVHYGYQSPAPAIWLSVALAFLAAVYSGAYAVITSISTIGLYLSYALPVYLHWRARGTDRELPRGPWHLGRWGRGINLVAIGWVVFLSAILSLPDDYRTGKTMVAVLGLLGLWYWTWERHHFCGPRWLDPLRAKEER